MVNKVDLGARIVSEISLRMTKTKEVPVVDFRVAHRDKNKTLFIDVEVWGDEARRVYEDVKRGDTVVIVGELRRDVWNSKNDGKPRSKIKITASRVVLTEQAKETIVIES